MNELVIRRATAADAAALLTLQQALDVETHFMMLEPGERPADGSLLAGRLEAAWTRRNCAVFVAQVAGAMAGYVEADGGVYRRNRHSATLVLGVRAAYARRGIGRALVSAVIAWAPSAGVSRLDLTVMAENVAAIALYDSLGFEREGLRRRSLIVDGAPVDELAMALLL